MIPTILNHAKSYLGTVQGDKRHKELIDQYNVVKPLPVGYKMKVTDDWCAAFVTVIADLSGAAAYIGRECGVQRYIQLFKRKEIWEGITKPRPSDLIVFDWAKDGWSDHIGIVESFDGVKVTAIEGNTSRCVARRQYTYNDWRISGYARPKYPSGEANSKQLPAAAKSHMLKSNEAIAKEVIAGKWGNGDTRKARLTAAGYEAQAVQKIVDSLLKANGSILKTNEAVAKEVIAGKWGNGEARKTRLTSAGYNYSAIQKIVNSII